MNDGKTKKTPKEQTLVKNKLILRDAALLAEFFDPVRDDFVQFHPYHLILRLRDNHITSRGEHTLRILRVLDISKNLCYDRP